MQARAVAPEAGCLPEPHAPSVMPWRRPRSAHELASLLDRVPGVRTGAGGDGDAGSPMVHRVGSRTVLHPLWLTVAYVSGLHDR
jgi:hypothetical protein